MNELDETQNSIMANIATMHKELSALLDQWDSFEERVSAILQAPVEVAAPEADISVKAAYDPSSRLMQEVNGLTDRIRNIYYRISDAKARVQL